MTHKIKDVEVLPWLEEAIQVYEVAPDKIEHLFMWCYVQGVTNAMKAFKSEEE